MPAAEPGEAGGPELTLVAVRLGDMTLTDGLACYQAPTGLMVPLGPLAGLLDLGIRVDSSRLAADGFILSEERRFQLDAATRTVRVGGREFRFTAGQVQSIGGELCVEHASLAAWLPLSLVFDPYASTLTVVPREPLPMQQRLERQRLIAGNLARMGARVPSGPLRETPYRLWDAPSIDQTLAVTVVPGETGGRRAWSQHTAYLSMDLLYTEAGARLTSQGQGGHSELRLHAGRRDLQGDLLGPLHARELAVGEIAFPGLETVSRPALGTGFLLSSFPLSQPSQFDRHTFRGDLPPGWEVELYRNGAILAYRQAGPAGTYVFEDVPLMFGWNSFRRVFHGPQGQRRVETDFFNVGADLTPPGKAYYRLAASGLGGAQERALLELHLGLPAHLSATASLAQARLGPETRRYAKLGARALAGNLLAGLDVAGDQGHGKLASASLQTRLGPLGITARHTRADGFRSEVVGTHLRSRRLSSLRLDALVHPPLLPAIPAVVEISRDLSDRTTDLRQVAARLSCSRRGLSVTSMSTWTRTLFPSTGGAPEDALRGLLLFSRQIQGFALRGEFDYDLDRRERRTALSLAAELPHGDGVQYGAGVTREMSTGRVRYQLSYQKTDGAVGVGVTTGYARDAGVTAGLSLSLGLNREPRTGRWHPHARPVAVAGAASARVFLDRNGNGAMDPGEEPIEGASLLLDESYSPGQTDRQGLAFLSHLPADRSVELGVVPGSLEDPQWVLERRAVEMVPRPGRVTTVDFPVAVSGEISGTLHRNAAASLRPAEGVEVQLVDEGRGRAVRRTHSDYDGFYNFAELLPGRYRVQFAAPQMLALGVVAPEPRQIEVEAGGTLREGVDFVLGPAGGAQATGSLALAPTTAGRASAASAAPPPAAHTVTVARRIPVMSAPKLVPAMPSPAPPAPPAAAPAARGTSDHGRTLAGLPALPRFLAAPDTTPRVTPGPRPNWDEPFREIGRALLRLLGAGRRTP
ncbi:MAG: carboxypeptidase regulatory-like domain-containing protein [Candidatus Eisenbacteria bacterium]|nr:carboxypeptidase regulatory-like domain-containing protein [Candidatus Eisenbacteria bacterium]